MHMVQGELKGLCGEAFGEALVYQHCELDLHSSPAFD